MTILQAGKKKKGLGHRLG